MNATELAKELINKFYPRSTSYSSDRKNQLENAKENALIAVDFMIERVKKTGEYGLRDEIKWYNRLKEEIVNFENQS